MKREKNEDNKRRTNFFEPTLFVKVMLAVMLLINFPYIGNLAKVIIKVIAAWGLMIVVINSKRILDLVKKNKSYQILFIMALSYSITILINCKYNLVQNCKSMMWFILYTNVLLVWWRFSKTKDLQGDIKQLNWIIIIVNLFNVVPSVLLYLASIGIQFQDRPIGIYATRLFGIMAGINSSVMIAFVSVIASLLNQKIDNKNTKLKKSLYIINVICSYIYMIASGTRVVRFNMIIILTLYSLILIWKSWNIKNYVMSRMKAIVYSVGIGIGLLFLIGSSVELSRYPIGMLPVKGIVIRDKDTENRSSEHRMQIWKECIELWKEHPVMGTANANMKIYADMSEKDFQYINISTYGASTHSLPIALMVYSGIVGTIIFGIYLVFRMLSCFIVLMKNLKMVDKEWEIMLLSFMVCLGLCIHSFFGTIVLFSNVENTILFWIYLGIMELSEEYINTQKNISAYSK